MVVIIKKGENVNHAGSDDAEKNSLDNDCHHQKGGEYECMNTGFWWCQSIIKHSRLSIASRLIQGQANKDQEKDKALNNLTGWLVFCLKQIVSKRSKTLVIDYQLV